MLVYRPSRGNNTVALTYAGQWTGQSIGREVIIRDKFGPSDYFLWYYSDLSTDSTWFYKPVTNVDFTTGTTYYRALYIGPNERENLQEFIGTINASTVSCGPSSTPSISATNEIQATIWQEGIFTTDNSKFSIVLDNESDSTGMTTAASAVFTSSITANQILSVGQWLKLWVKIYIPPNPLLVDEEVCYFVNIGSLSINIKKDISRISMSRVFHGDIKNNDIVLKELIPKIDEIYKIQKVINLDPDQTHIFYNTSGGNFHDLIIERHNNAFDNKFIDVDASPITGPISGFDIESLFTLQAIQDVFNCAVSGSLEKKYIVDIFKTNLPERSYFYIFFNQLKQLNNGETVSTSAETFDKYEANFGHKLYYWTSGVISLDLNAFRKETFNEIEGGYDNRLLASNWTGQENIIRNNFFITSISLQDDLFTTIGYNTENAYQTEIISAAPGLVAEQKNYFTELTFVWEKDILLNNLVPQILKAPELAIVNTISERSENIAQLVIDNLLGIDNFDLQHYRNIQNLQDASGSLIQYCDLGPPHRNKLKHYNDASISFDTQEELSEWSSTFAFRLGVVSTSAANLSAFDFLNASQKHIINSEVYANTTGSSAISYPLLQLPPSISGEISLFSVNVKNTDYNAIEVFYNIPSSELLIIVRDVSGSILPSINVPVKLYLGQENVFTINTYKKQVYDDGLCSSRSFINYQIYLNGQNVNQGITFIVGSLDPVVLTYNQKKQFSGSLSYFEVKQYIDKIDQYASAMYNIHSNICWPRILFDAPNTNTLVKDLQIFKNKRIIYFNNLNKVNDIVIPITLQGKGYDFSNFGSYNKESLRTYDESIPESIIFDFKNINLNDIDIAFTALGDTALLEWTADEYDILNDSLTIWLKIPHYSGQRFVMYYNSQRISALAASDKKNAFKSLHGAWTMNKFAHTFGYRFIDQKVFNSGENIIYLKHNQDRYLIQIDYQYMYGQETVYKSNKFDVAFDDRQISLDDMPVYEDFINNNVKLFKPDYMTINKVRSKFNYRLESDNSIPKD